LNEAVAAYQASAGVLPSSLQSLVDAGLLPQIPPEPFGGTYVLDPATGTVGSSTGHRPLQVHRSKKGEAVLRGEVPE
jgi:hypothetical protein